MRYSKEWLELRIYRRISELASKLGCEEDDIRQELAIARIEARRSWDRSGEAPLRWYIRMCQWRRFRDLERMAKTGRMLRSLGDVYEPLSETSVLARMIAEEVVNKLRPRLLEIVTEILVNGRTVREVADQQILSTTRVFQLLEQGRQRLRDLASRN